MSIIPQPYIITSAIDLNKIMSLAHHAKAGAIVLFSGEVRNHHEGESVDFLEYEAQEEMAAQSIHSILEETLKKWPLHFAFAQHRIGKVDIMESAVAVVTSSSHRLEAYEANQYIIDRIKAETPIWKKEHFASGEAKWK